MKAFWTCAAASGLVLSMSAAAFAECAGHGQQTVKADVPVTIASAPVTTTTATDKK